MSLRRPPSTPSSSAVSAKVAQSSATFAVNDDPDMEVSALRASMITSTMDNYVTILSYGYATPIAQHVMEKNRTLFWWAVAFLMFFVLLYQTENWLRQKQMHTRVKWISCYQVALMTIQTVSRIVLWVIGLFVNHGFSSAFSNGVYSYLQSLIPLLLLMGAYTVMIRVKPIPEEIAAIYDEIESQGRTALRKRRQRHAKQQKQKLVSEKRTGGGVLVGLLEMTSQ
jgi:hypothetical protein